MSRARRISRCAVHARAFLILAVLPLLPPRASAAAEPPAETLAVVGARTIAAADLREEVARRAASEPGRAWTDGELREVLGDLVRTEAAATLAREAGYERRPEVRRAIDRLLASRYAAEMLEPKLAALALADDEVARHYEEHPDEFRLPRRVRGAVVRIEGPRKAADAERAARRRRAEKALAEARRLPASAPGFGQVAVSHSDDQATRYRGGDTGLVTEQEAAGRWGKETAAALFALGAPGQIGPLVETGEGFDLVKLVEDLPASVRPLAQVREALRRKLLAGKIEARTAAFATDVARQAGVRMDTALAERTIVGIREEMQAAREASPPPLPGSTPGPETGETTPRKEAQ